MRFCTFIGIGTVVLRSSAVFHVFSEHYTCKMFHVYRFIFHILLLTPTLRFTPCSATGYTSGEPTVYWSDPNVSEHFVPVWTPHASDNTILAC